MEKPRGLPILYYHVGIFHTLMFLGIIGKRFGDGGYRYLLVQSEVIAEGSVDRALSGKCITDRCELSSLPAKPCRAC